MKIKFEASTGEIVAAGEMPELKTVGGFVVEDIETTERAEDLIGKIRVSKNTIRAKSKTEKDAEADKSKNDRKALINTLKAAGITKEVFHALRSVSEQDFDL